MKLMFTLLLFLTFGASQAQKAKILAGDKVEYDKMSRQELAKTDAELSRNMDLVLGFGLKIKVIQVEQKIKSKDADKEKNAVRFQIGLKLPRFINTDPPDKVFKIGWDFGVVK
jgi:hypothetical protein